MSYTLAQLRTDETAATIRARLVANMVAAGFPVSDWAPSAAGGIENAILDGIAGTLGKYTGTIARQIAEMGLFDFARGPALRFMAAGRVAIFASPASKTTIWVRLTSTQDAPPYQIAVGQMIFSGLTGNKYVGTTGGDLPPGGTLFVQAEAENAGASYAEADGTIDSSKNPSALVTPLPGVAAVNVPPTVFTKPKLAGNSAGTLTAFDIVDPDGFQKPPISTSIRVTTSGDVGSGAWQWTFNNGATWNAGGPFVSQIRIFDDPTESSGLMATIGFTEAPGVSPSFLLGDSWTFQRATATIVQGKDDESDDALIAAGRARWPALADVPTASLIALWGRQAVARVGQILVDADPDVPGQVRAVVAGATGAIDSGAAADVQDFVVARLRGYKALRAIREQIVVVLATPREIVGLGLVRVPRTQVAQVQAGALANWIAALGRVRIKGTVELSDLVQSIMDAGAISIETESLTGGTPNIQLGPQEVAVPPAGSSIITSMAWVPT